MVLVSPAEVPSFCDNVAARWGHLFERIGVESLSVAYDVLEGKRGAWDRDG